MATIMRLTRTGRRNRPYYRIVVMDSRKRRDGRYIEKIGTYDPIKKDDNVIISEERVQYWLNKGVQLSDTVKSMLSHKGILLKNYLEKSNLNDELKNQEIQKWETLQKEKAKQKEAFKKLKTEEKPIEKKKEEDKEDSIEQKETEDKKVEAKESVTGKKKEENEKEAVKQKDLDDKKEADEKDKTKEKSAEKKKEENKKESKKQEEINEKTDTNKLKKDETEKSK
ncbi:MAG: 30S ribosomal protein S16 [Candidatus Marinimicrobia bacterium]|nr:30S ribosomal protein S16 [Candidatus Neomarinimicrobiota bacterium]